MGEAVKRVLLFIAGEGDPGEGPLQRPNVAVGLCSRTTRAARRDNGEEGAVSLI